MKTPLRTQTEARQWMDEQGLSMAELARRKSDLEKKLSEPLAPQEIGALGLELQAVTDALAAAEESWLGLSEQIELEK